MADGWPASRRSTTPHLSQVPEFEGRYHSTKAHRHTQFGVFGEPQTQSKTCTRIHLYLHPCRKEGMATAQSSIRTLPAPGWRGRRKRCGLLWARITGVSSTPVTVADAPEMYSGICEWNVLSGVACGCMYAHTCVELSAPSAAESLVYSSSTLGPKLPLCWPPKPACLFQPFWPPVSKLGRKHPPLSWLMVRT